MRVVTLCTLMLFAVLAQPASAATGGARFGGSPAAARGGAQPGDVGSAPLPGAPRPVVAGTKAVALPDGSAAAPAQAPAAVQQAIWAANALQSKPYRYGGGHADFADSGYDCSGTVSFALNGAGLLKRPLDSSSFMAWGERGPGAWFTVYSNPGHAYLVVAGLRLDTSAGYSRGATVARVTSKARERGPRWRPSPRPSRGFSARHPAGL